MVAALCMVLYGYDASVFNSVQGSENWLEWVNLDPDKDTYMLGLSTIPRACLSHGQNSHENALQ